MSLRDEVAKRVHLDRQGWGLCPFHQEKTKSFHVFFATKGKHKGEEIYFCQGCGAKGDIRDWCRLVEGKAEEELPTIIKRSPSQVLQDEHNTAIEADWQELLNRYPDLPEEARMFIAPDLGARLRRRLNFGRIIR